MRNLSRLRSTRTAIALLLAIGLIPAAAQAGRFNRGLSSVHQPVVRRSDFVMDVAGSGLDPVEATRVQQWFDAIGLGYGDRISVDASMASTASNKDIAALVGHRGLFLSDGAPATEGAIAPGQVRIIVSRSTASVPGCPDYTQPSQPNFTGAASSNYGCASNSMLAAMIANPADLVRGQEADGSNAETATKAIRVWRNAEPTSKGGLKLESTKGGN